MRFLDSEGVPYYYNFRSKKVSYTPPLRKEDYAASRIQARVRAIRQRNALRRRGVRVKVIRTGGGGRSGYDEELLRQLEDEDRRDRAAQRVALAWFCRLARRALEYRRTRRDGSKVLQRCARRALVLPSWLKVRAASHRVFASTIAAIFFRAQLVRSGALREIAAAAKCVSANRSIIRLRAAQINVMRRVDVVIARRKRDSFACWILSLRLLGCLHRDAFVAKSSAGIFLSNLVLGQRERRDFLIVYNERLEEIEALRAEERKRRQEEEEKRVREEVEAAARRAAEERLRLEELERRRIELQKQQEAEAISQLITQLLVQTADQITDQIEAKRAALSAAESALETALLAAEEVWSAHEREAAEAAADAARFGVTSQLIVDVATAAEWTPEDLKASESDGVAQAERMEPIPSARRGRSARPERPLSERLFEPRGEAGELVRPTTAHERAEFEADQGADEEVLFVDVMTKDGRDETALRLADDDESDIVALVEDKATQFEEDAADASPQHAEIVPDDVAAAEPSQVAEAAVVDVVVEKAGVAQDMRPLLEESEVPPALFVEGGSEDRPKMQKREADSALELALRKERELLAAVTLQCAQRSRIARL